MKEGFRRSMSWLHTWTGLLLGWVLFAMFLTGSAAYYRWEITHWMQPELRSTSQPLETALSAVTRLENIAADSPQWFIDLPDGRNDAARLLWRIPGPERRFGQETMDPANGRKALARETLGGDFFYRFHFQFHLPPLWGRYLAGLAAMFMLAALATGVIAHRRFFADFFTFRPGRPGLRSWLDFHNLAGVLTLPFCLVLAYSGLVILSPLYMPWGRLALAEPAHNPPAAGPIVTKHSIPMAPLAPMLQAADEAWGRTENGLRRIEISGRGTEACIVTLVRGQGRSLSVNSAERLRFNGASGLRLDAPSGERGPAGNLHGALYGLHLARFAGPFLRCLLFLTGLLATALIGTGLVLWTQRRRSSLGHTRPAFGLVLLEKLNLACIAGLPLSIAAFFWANRLVPATLEGRSDVEVQVFFCVWAAAVAHAFIRPQASAWREQLDSAGLLYLCLPALDLLTSGKHLQAAVINADRAHLGFLATMLVCGLLLLRISAKMRAHANPPSHTTQPATAEESVT